MLLTAHYTCLSPLSLSLSLSLSLCSPGDAGGGASTYTAYRANYTAYCAAYCTYQVTQEVEFSQEGLVSNAKVELKLPLFSSVGEVTLLLD